VREPSGGARQSLARKPRLIDRLEYAAFAAATAGANRVSEARAERFGESLGRLAYRSLRIRRDVVEEHLRLAFPDRSLEWVHATAEESYLHLGRELMTTMRLSHWSRDEVVRRVHHELGRERFYQALGEGKGLVLAGSHFGNWELGAASVAAQGYPVDAVYQPQRNPLFNEAMLSARRRLGVEVIPRTRAAREALPRLRAGRIVAFVADQNAGRNGVFVPFFGRLASTHRGAALMAVRSGAPLFFGAAVRQGDGYLGMSEEITESREGPVDQVVERLTAAFTAVLERLVRQWPGQYFWHHRRWKTRPEGETRN
jgi:Kdo2-lipid IVA lauroyltransferase/acyltransferase